MGEVLKTLGITTLSCIAAYAATTKIDKYIEEQGELEHSQEYSNILKVCAVQTIGIITFAVDRYI